MLRIQKLISTRFVGYVLLLAFGPAFMAITSPDKMPLALLIVPFLWAFASIFATTWLLCGLVGSLAVGRRRLILSGVIATLPVLLLVLNSIHQLTIRDLLIVLTIVGLLTLYMSRADFIK